MLEGIKVLSFTHFLQGRRDPQLDTDREFESIRP